MSDLDNIREINNCLPPSEILAGVAEEATELAQAALKLRRALDGTNPTPRSVDVCRAKFREELGDLLLCLAVLDDGEPVRPLSDEQRTKLARWIYRLRAANGTDEGHAGDP